MIATQSKPLADRPWLDPNASAQVLIEGVSKTYGPHARAVDNVSLSQSGLIVGSPLKGKVVIVDDVITAGTAVRESVELIRAAGAEPVGVALALDRQERGRGERSAVQEVESLFGLKCVTILTLGELIAALEERSAAGQADPLLSPTPEQLAAMRTYRLEYGVT